ncbi:hypothetical protein [Paenibacillus sp. IHBB 10380]|uniref:hypothetical protein n=1 Tax=Paenibacillus sp. IHBB 10380 TaxID=1566358 RepID=UPI000A6EED97|nr:hypothetical protein [Paenibacillus sp. IHBB 10380]
MRWSTRDKFSILVETATLNEIELSEYCRTKGLFVEQVEAWRDAFVQVTEALQNKLQNHKRNYVTKNAR